MQYNFFTPLHSGLYTIQHWTLHSSQKSQTRLSYSWKLASHTPFCDCLPFPVSLSHSLTSVSWNHFPNKLCCTWIFFQVMHLGEPKLRHCHIWIYFYYFSQCHHASPSPTHSRPSIHLAFFIFSLPCQLFKSLTFYLSSFWGYIYFFQHFF